MKEESNHRSIFVWASLGLLIIIGIISYIKLPRTVAIQWSGTTASDYADKVMLFFIPAVGVVATLFLQFVFKVSFQKWFPIVKENYVDYLNILVNVLGMVITIILFVFNWKYR